MATYYCDITGLHGFFDGNGCELGSTSWAVDRSTEFIWAVQVNEDGCNKSTTTQQFKVQFIDWDAGTPTWTDVGSATAISWASGLLTDGASGTSLGLGTNPDCGTGTPQWVYENAGDNLAPDSSGYSTASGDFGELHWNLSAANATLGHRYALRIVNVTDSNTPLDGYPTSAAGQTLEVYDEDTPTALTSSNDLSDDSDAEAHYKFESGALTTDTLGNQNLSTWTGTCEISDTSNYWEGSGCAKLIAAGFEITDSTAPSTFPLKYGGSNTDFTLTFRFQPLSTSSSTLLNKHYGPSSQGLHIYTIGVGGGTCPSCVQIRIVANSNTYSHVDDGGGDPLTLGYWYSLAISYVHSTGSWHIRIWDENTDSLLLDDTLSGLAITVPNIDYSLYPAYHRLDEVCFFSDVLSTTEMDEVTSGTYGSSTTHVVSSALTLTLTPKAESITASGSHTVSSALSLTLTNYEETVTVGHVVGAPLSLSITPQAESVRVDCTYTPTSQSLSLQVVENLYYDYNQIDVGYGMYNATNSPRGTALRVIGGKYRLSSIAFPFRNLGSAASGPVDYRIYAVTGTPGTDAKPADSSSPIYTSSDTFNASEVSTSYKWFKLHFDNIEIQGDYGYCANYTAGDASHYISIGCDSTPADALANIITSNTGVWTASTTVDQCIRLYATGWDLSIDSAHIVGSPLSLTLTNYPETVDTGEADVVHVVGSALSLSFTINQETTHVDCTYTSDIIVMAFTGPYLATVGLGGGYVMPGLVAAMNFVVLIHNETSDVTYNANAQSLTLTNYEETVTTEANVTHVVASPLSLSFTNYAETLLISSTHIVASPLSLSFTNYPETVTADLTYIVGSALSLTLTNYQESVFSGTTVFAGTQSLTLTNYAESTVSDVTFTPTLLSLTLTNHEETVTTSADETHIVGSVLTLSFTSYAENVLYDTTYSANVQSLSFTINQETTFVDCTYNANTQSLSFTINQETTVADATYLAGTQSLTFTINQETTSSDINYLANSQTLTFSINQESVTADVVYSANVQSLTLTNQDEVVSLSRTHDAGVQALNLAVGTASYRSDVTWAPASQSLSLTVYPETVQTGNDIFVNVGIQALSLTINPETLDISCSYSAGTQSLTLTQYNESTTSDVAYNANLQSLTLSQLAETIQSDTTYTPSTLPLSLSVGSANFISDAVYSANVQTLTATINPESVIIEVASTVYPSVQSLTLTQYPESLSADCNLSVGVQTLTLTYNQESIILEVIVPAGLQTLSVSVNGVTTQSDVAVDANLQTLLIVQLAETVSVPGLVTATLQTLTAGINSAVVHVDADISANVIGLSFIQYPPEIISPNNVTVLGQTIPMVFSTHIAVPLNVTFGKVKMVEFSSRAPFVEMSERAPTVVITAED